MMESYRVPALLLVCLGGWAILEVILGYLAWRSAQADYKYHQIIARIHKMGRNGVQRKSWVDWNDKPDPYDLSKRR